MNNNLYKNVLKKYKQDIKKVELKSNSIIFTDSLDKKYVVKENNNDIKSIYNYLNSRGFKYVPKLVYCNDFGYIYEYINNTNMPNEQRMSDLIKTDALLHNKTVYYKDTSLDETKKIYEDLSGKIRNTFNYYDDLINSIEASVYMSPSSYLLIRNCSSVFSCINFCQRTLDDWYNICKNKNKKREVLLHNNLDTTHYLRDDENILISWNRAVRDLPIYDFIKLYRNNYDKYDFNQLYKEYQKHFPLLEEEKKLMFVILFLPKKIEFDDTELNMTVKVGKLCNYLYLTDKLFMENEAKNTNIQNQNINEEQKYLESNT